MKVLVDEAATVAAGADLAEQLKEKYSGSALVFLLGNLGAGKTTFTRGLIQGFGHSGAVKSPTYTLLEPYELAQGAVYHFDLYRISDPQELEFVGIDEIIDGSGIKVFEWPQKAAQWLPEPDVTVELEVNEQDPNSRNLTILFS